MRIHAFPHCCGMAIITHFGFDTRHDWRPENRQEVDDVQTFLEEAARAGQDGSLESHTGVRIGRVGMLVAALNISQREALWPMMRRLGWRRAGAANNLHVGDGSSDVYLFRKVLADARHNAND